MTPPGVIVAFLCDSGAEYKCHDLLTYLLIVYRCLFIFATQTLLRHPSGTTSKVNSGWVLGLA